MSRLPLLERVSTAVLALDGTGGATFFADYAQWESAHEEADRDVGGRIEAPARTAVEVRRLTLRPAWLLVSPSA